MEERLSFYHPVEEMLNVVSHGLGLILSVVGLVVLLIYAFAAGTAYHVAGLGIYGVSMVVLYSASTSYHFVQEPKLRYILNIFDHSAIYCLIAGSYTPFALLFFEPKLGWTIFIAVWTIAAVGIIFKLFFTGKYNFFGTATYVLMGWMGLFAMGPILEGFPVNGVIWIFAGGLFYTIGAILYSIQKLTYNHAIFHVFVLLGSISHFVSVFYYLIPGNIQH